MKCLVKVDHVSKKFKGFMALNNVSFQINEGEILGYIGPNGAGKTTTIKILTGLIRDFGGEVSIDGLPIPSKIEEATDMLGYLPQHVSFQDWRTVDHALSTFGKLSGMTDDDLERRIVEVLELVGLSDVRHKKITELSGGMVQKVGFAQALLHNPKLLVLDEPLSGLDPESRYRVKKIIKDLSKNGTTVFFSSHILSDVQDVATRIGIITLGQIIKIGTVDELNAHFSITNHIDIELSKGSEYWKNLESITGITNIERPSPNRFLVHTKHKVDIDEIIYNIIQKLTSLDCRIRSIKPVTSSLDEIYLKYMEGGVNQ